MSSSMRSTCAGVVLACLLCACSSAQSRRDSYLAHGRAYLTAGNFAKARIEFSNAAQIDPKDADARLMLGRVAEKLGDTRSAMGNYQTALQIDPKQADARAAMGRLYLYAGLAEKARSLADAGLKLAPDNAALLTVRAGARSRLGDLVGGVQDAQRALQLAPDDQYAVALLTSLYKQQSDFDRAVAVARKGLARAPDSVDLHAILADLELAQNHPAQAQAELQRVIELAPTLLPYRYTLARFYIQQKDEASAEKTLREAVRSQPQSIDGKVQLVGYLAQRHSLDAAVSEVRQIIAVEPDNQALQLALGAELAQVGRPTEAEAVFRAIIAHTPPAAPEGLAARDQLAALMLARNDVAAAHGLIAEVLKQNLRDNDALVLSARISMAGGDTQSAISNLRAVLRDQPNNVAIMRALAEAYQRNDERDLAQRTLRDAVQTAPKDFQSRFDLAQVLVGMGEPEQAEPLLKQLESEDGNSVPVKELLFRTLSAEKQYTSARAVAQDIERISPDRALGYYLQGLADELDQRPDAALGGYEAALRHQPDATEPLEAIVHLDVSRKQAGMAAERVNAAIVRLPQAAAPRLLKGELALAQGNFAAAVDAYQEAVKLAPDWSRAYEGLARAQSAARRFGDAVMTLRTGVARAGADAAPLIRDLGRLYERLGRPDDAIALYSDYLAANRSAVFAANNLAMLLVTYRRDPASLSRARELAERLSASSEVSVLDTRGWVKFKTGDVRGAESLLLEAVNRRPAEPEMHFHLAMTQLNSGERESAEQNLKIALSLDEPFVGIEDAKAALAQLRTATSSTDSTRSKSL